MSKQKQLLKSLVVLLIVLIGLGFALALPTLAIATNRLISSEYKSPHGRSEITLAREDSNFPSAATTNTCFAEYTGDNTTDFASTDNSAVQNAVDAANPGDTVKIAGTCSGVLVREGFTQTVYISKSLTIQGGHTESDWSLEPDPDAFTTTLDAIHGGSVILITGTVNVNLDSLTLTRGKASLGGGIWTNPDVALTLLNSKIFNNTATSGGGIFNSEGTLTVTNTSIFSNTADLGGGIYNISSTATINNCDIYSNTAGQGAGISNYQTLLFLSESSIRNNLADVMGGGFWNVYVTSNINNSIIHDNYAGLQGGGFWNVIFTSTVNNSTINGNTSDQQGGGFWNVSGYFTMNNSIVSENTADLQGGGFWDVEIYETIENSTISANNAGSEGGGFWSTAVTSTLNNSTMARNEAGTTGGSFAALSGSNITITNSTIYGNKVTTSTLLNDVGGGAAYLFDDAWFNLQSSTMVSNTAPNLSGLDGLVLTGTARMSLTNSLLAYNDTASCTLNNLSSVTDGGYNLEDNDTCGLSASSSLTETVPMVLPLADNGGATWTNAILPGSPAIDVIPPVTNGCGSTFMTDQRGVSRPQWNGCDIGSYEAAASELKVSTGGNGAGSVTSAPTGIDCTTSNSGDCSEIYAYGTEVTLKATADPHSSFEGWSGSCSGTVSCLLVMTQTRDVIANFILDQHELAVNLVGSGSGTVSSSPSGINCGSDCSESYDYGTVVSLSAAADSGSSFTGWGGACAGTGVCQLTITADKAVTAKFDPQAIYLPIISQ
jgi:hypothetical protein